MTEKSNQDRPLVTFALFAYNQENFIREAVNGAFSQTYQPLEIILSDDCSGDRTFGIMQEMATSYDGPHQVRARRNEVNLGIANHVNALMKISSGEIFLLAAGDDISLPERTTVSVDSLNRNRASTAVLLSADTIDRSGNLIKSSPKKAGEASERIQTIHDLLLWRHVTSGATRAIRRDVFSKFGPLNVECPTEDTPLLLRSLNCGDNVVSQHKGILYRRHDKNLSNATSLKKMNTNAIYEQYKDDIIKAEYLGIISSKIADQLRKWLLLDMRVRSIRLKDSLGENLQFEDLLFSMRHRSFSFRTKKYYLLKFLDSIS